MRSPVFQERPVRIENSSRKRCIYPRTSRAHDINSFVGPASPIPLATPASENSEHSTDHCLHEGTQKDTSRVGSSPTPPLSSQPWFLSLTSPVNYRAKAVADLLFSDNRRGQVGLDALIPFCSAEATRFQDCWQSNFKRNIFLKLGS